MLFELSSDYSLSVLAVLTSKLATVGRSDLTNSYCSYPTIPADVRDKDGKTAADIARWNRYKDIPEFITNYQSPPRGELQ